MLPAGGYDAQVRFVNEWLSTVEGHPDHALANRAAALLEWLVTLLGAEHFEPPSP